MMMYIFYLDLFNSNYYLGEYIFCYFKIIYISIIYCLNDWVIEILYKYFNI